MKKIIITGASGILGNYLVKKYINEGYKVIGTTRSKNIKIKNKNFFLYKVNLSSKLSTNKFFKKISTKFKKVDYIISCVGKSNFKKNEDQWKKGLDDNLLSNVNIINEFLVIFKKKASLTKIIVISSIAGIKAIPAPISYSVSKNALIYYCKLKSLELAKLKININCISPGNILMQGNVWEKKILADRKKTLAYISKKVPLKNFCLPDHIKGACDLLMSNAGNFMTGANLIIDGGQTINE